MYRLPLLATAALGCVLLTSCDPFGPPPGPSPYGPGPRPPYQPQGPVRGDGYAGDPYGNPGPSSDPYGQSDGGGYDQEPPQRNTPPPTTPPGGGNVGGVKKEYPVAERTAKPNEVISPYAPYNVIDVSEMRSGQLARDPSNRKIFQVP